MRFTRDDPGYDRLATIDIETTHYDAAQGEIVAIGVGAHHRGTPAVDADYELFYRQSDDDEADVIKRSFEWLDDADADALVSYNGIGFDMDFCYKRLGQLGITGQSPPALHAEDSHVDLFADRAEQVSRYDRPSLEDCLESYGITPPKTVWNGDPLTNTRFGEELGPAYLSAVRAGDDLASDLRDVIDHYLLTDLEANIALFYGDAGDSFEPAYLGNDASFSVPRSA